MSTTLLKATIFLSLIAATLPTTVAAQPATDEQTRYDLACATAAAWALSWMGSDHTNIALQNVRNVSYFYLGRLTGRDGNTNWLPVIARELTQRRQAEGAYSAVLSKCTQDMTDTLLPKR